LVQICVRGVLCVRVCNREATVRVWGCWDGMGESSMIVVHGAGMSACRRQEQEMAYMRCKAVQGGADTRRHSSNISHPQGTTLPSYHPCPCLPRTDRSPSPVTLSNLRFPPPLGGAPCTPLLLLPPRLYHRDHYYRHHGHRHVHGWVLYRSTPFVRRKSPGPTKGSLGPTQLASWIYVSP
jgi:hypothetical protein